MKKWMFAKPVPEEIAKEYDIPRILTQILWNRGIISSGKDQEAVETFLYPDFERHLHNPNLLKNMYLARHKVLLAIKNRQKIWIYGDFDVDGVTGSALLYESLKQLGALVSVYIPDREKEGYGINLEAVEKIAQEGCNLLITIDCGITSVKEVERAKNLGMDVIVVDHHIPQKNTPQCLIINPKQKGDKYPFKDLSACALAWKLSLALLSESGSHKPKALNFLKWQLDLVGLSTICDVVPLIGENRTLAVYGLKVLRKTRRPGLLKMYEVAGISRENINSYTVGFILGPRLNAPGRLRKANSSFRLLTTSDEKEAAQLAKLLNTINVERQELLDEAVKEARELVFSAGLHKKKALILTSKKWVSGIVGLIASRLVQDFNRPAFVLSFGDKESKGSARSIEGFHLVEALSCCSDLLVRHGGHAKAAGLSLLNEKLEMFKQKIISLAEEKLSDEDIAPKINIDSAISPEELTFDFFDKWLKLLEPFGLGNPKPVFFIPDAKITDLRWCGKAENHLRLGFQFGGQSFWAAGFDWQEKNVPKIGETANLAITLDEDEWAGSKKLSLKLIDLKSEVDYV